MIRSTKTDTSTECAKLMGKINNEAADVDETLYFLKIQYHLLDISTRAKNNTGIEMKSKVRLLRDIIKAINFHKSLGMLLKVDTKHTEEQFLSIQNIRTFLSSLQLPQGQTEYLELLKRLKQRFHGTIQKSKIISVKEIPENCNLCDHQIGPGLNCVQLHAFKRCVYTNLQVRKILLIASDPDPYADYFVFILFHRFPSYPLKVAVSVEHRLWIQNQLKGFWARKSLVLFVRRAMWRLNKSSVCFLFVTTSVVWIHVQVFTVTIKVLGQL